MVYNCRFSVLFTLVPRSNLDTIVGHEEDMGISNEARGLGEYRRRLWWMIGGPARTIGIMQESEVMGEMKEVGMNENLKDVIVARH